MKEKHFPRSKRMKKFYLSVKSQILRHVRKVDVCVQVEYRERKKEKETERGRKTNKFSSSVLCGKFEYYKTPKTAMKDVRPNESSVRALKVELKERK